MEAIYFCKGEDVSLAYEIKINKVTQTKICLCFVIVFLLFTFAFFVCKMILKGNINILKLE